MPGQDDSMRKFEALLKQSSLYGPEPTAEELDAAADMWEAATPTEPSPHLTWSPHPRDLTKQVASSETHSYVVTQRGNDVLLAVYERYGSNGAEEDTHGSVAEAMEEAQSHHSDQVDHIHAVAHGITLMTPDLQQLLWRLIWAPPHLQENERAARICKWLGVTDFDDPALLTTMIRRSIPDEAAEATSQGPWKVAPPVEGDPQWLVRKESGPVLARFALQQDAEHCVDLHNRHRQHTQHDPDA